MKKLSPTALPQIVGVAMKASATLKKLAAMNNQNAIFGRVTVFHTARPISALQAQSTP